MLTTNTPGYVTLRNLLKDLETRGDSEIESYLQTLTPEDLHTLEEVANKECWPALSGSVHAHALARRLPAGSVILTPAPRLASNPYREPVEKVLKAWEEMKTRHVFGTTIHMTPSFPDLLAELKAVHESTKS